MDAQITFERVVIVGSVKNLTGPIGIGGGTVLTIPVPVDIAPGRFLAVALASRGAYGQAIWDSAGSYPNADTDNRYYSAIIPAANFGSSVLTYVTLDYANVQNGLAAGSSIYVEMVSGACESVAYSILEFSGVPPSAAVFPDGIDQRTAASGSVRNVSSGRFTTTAPIELMIGVIALNAPAGDAFTPDAGWIAPAGSAVGTLGGLAVSNTTVGVCYRITSTAGRYTFGGQLSSKRDWLAAVASFQ